MFFSQLACNVTTFNVLLLYACHSYKLGLLQAYSMKSSASDGAVGKMQNCKKWEVNADTKCES